MKTICPSCSSIIETPYFMLGAGVVCNSCKNIVLPKVENGTQLPYTGAEITFRDFIQLLTNKDSRQRVLPLINKWAPEIENLTSIEKVFKVGSSEEKALIEIHCKIQSNSATQGELYQVAMSLWR